MLWSTKPLQRHEILLKLDLLRQRIAAVQLRKDEAEAELASLKDEAQTLQMELATFDD